MNIKELIVQIEDDIRDVNTVIEDSLVNIDRQKHKLCYMRLLLKQIKEKKKEKKDAIL